jgi:CRISPR-associated exonuclease Cas4
MNAETLVPLDLKGALSVRFENNARLGNRRSYVGASEIGSCLRKVVAAKLTPGPFDAASMGRMLAGRAMENEVVQLVRLALLGSLRNTGRNQLELEHPELPFRAHPDGRIIGDTGDGILEVKTASAILFKQFKADGLPQAYLDQVQAQLGLAGLSWGLVVLVSRENLAEVETIQIPFDPLSYECLVDRARTAAEALRLACLPSGEPGRGGCHGCPFAEECPEHQAQRKALSDGQLPDVTCLELEYELEELAGLESDLEPIQRRISELRDRLKAHLLETGLSRVQLEGGTVQLISSTRDSLDGKALQRDSPEVYQRYLRSSHFSTLRVTFHGDHP